MKVSCHDNIRSSPRLRQLRATECVEQRGKQEIDCGTPQFNVYDRVGHSQVWRSTSDWLRYQVFAQTNKNKTPSHVAIESTLYRTYEARTCMEFG